jgi:hypothetical protein
VDLFGKLLQLLPFYRYDDFPHDRFWLNHADNPLRYSPTDRTRRRRRGFHHRRNGHQSGPDTRVAVTLRIGLRSWSAPVPPLPLLPERPKLAPVSPERGSNPLRWDAW